ncbi:MAG: DUF433 domain-containing protein [bacterium]
MKEGREVNPNIHFGKPCVANTRIPVQNVLELVRKDISFEQDYYPNLQVEDIRAYIVEPGDTDLGNLKGSNYYGK